ncbi:MAG TPA: RNA polymerase subunit sigma-24 [Clostridiales bacterium UBA8960]|nr:RNA polymerase subunit sigma-24 [Clostridiales bacterium UBA8960]
MKQIEKLYELYKQDVYFYILSLTHDHTLSEDLLSETFVQAITAIERFKGQSSIKTWLFSIARNLWLQHLRKEKPSVAYNDLLEIYVSNNIERDFITKEAASRISELISELDERTQKVVYMRVEGYSYTEIAAQLGLSEGSARVIDFRTKKWIKTVLEKEEM